MILSHERKFVFAAFNKTASTSIERALRSYGIGAAEWNDLERQYRSLHPSAAVFKHARPLHLKQLLGETLWDEYFTFAFVRNPWSRIVSLYEYHHRRAEQWPLAQKSFREWLHAGGTGTVARSMSEFVTDEESRVIVKFIGRYESLERDFARACAAAGLPDLRLPHEGHSVTGDYRRYYDDETREIVSWFARRDIEMFGYEF